MNLISCSAGIKDSALTIHGNLQVKRLGRYFAQAGVHFTNIFSSDLQRAFKTAEAIRIAQSIGNDQDKVALREVAQLTVLREQDFGSYEGQPFYSHPHDPKKSGNADDMDINFKDVESIDSMTRRMDSFVRDHLLPLLYGEGLKVQQTVAVVSHGIILSHLWRYFLSLFPPGSVTLNPNLLEGTEGTRVVLEHLGGWSNTGYLELDILPGPVDPVLANDSANSVPQVPQHLLKGLSLQPLPFKMTVNTVNGKEHLKNLKRTGGGIGSSVHDERQRKIDSFFKRQKLGD